MTHQELSEAKNDLRNTVFLNFSSTKNQLTKQDMIEWFSKMRIFKPTRMSVPNKSARYNADMFEQLIRTCDDWGTYKLENRSNFCLTFQYGSMAAFSARMPLDVWKERERDLVCFLEDYFVRMDGCFGYVVNYFDDYIVQNPFGGGRMSSWKLDDTDFPDIQSIPLTFAPNNPNYIFLDPSYLPGHRYRFEKVDFVVSAYMWMGPDIFYIISNDKLKSVCECEENTEFTPGFRRICLWKNLVEYNHPTYRERQWAFREVVDWQESMQDLYEKLPKHYEEENKKRATVEMWRGTFPNGGTLLVRYYVDKRGKACGKHKAYAYIEREMDGNTIIKQERTKIETGKK